MSGVFPGGAEARLPLISARRLPALPWKDIGLLAVLLVIAGVVHAIGMTRYPAPFDDEGTYVAQAWAVQHWQSLAHYTYWYDHPPLGWLGLSLWTWLTETFGSGLNAVPAARDSMLVVQLASCALLYVLALRLGLRRVFAALTVLLFALSPLAVEYHRMVLLDNMAVLLVLAAFVFALTPSRRLWAFAASGACFGLAVLTKETTILIVPALGLAMWTRADTRTRRFCLALSAALFLIIVGVYPLTAVLQGELFPGAGHVSLIDGMSFQLTRQSSGSVFDASSGTYQLVTGWLERDPFLLAAAAVLAPIALLSRNLRPIGLAFAILLLMALRPGGYLPAMYVIGLLPFAALIVGGSLDRIQRGLVPLAQILGMRRGPGSWRSRTLISSPRLLVTLLVVALAAIVAPKWIAGDRTLMTTDETAALRVAETWLVGNADRESRILVDDTFWVDLVERGFEPEQVIWFFKLDLDPAVHLPNGWRDIDYVVASNMVVGNLDELPTARAAYENSVPVAVFQSGDERIEIRRVMATGGPDSEA